MISVIHPTIRPDKALEVFRAWRDAAAGTDWEYIIVNNPGIFPVPEGDGYRVTTAPGAGCIAALNHGASIATGDVLMMAADDLYPAPKWDEAITARIGDTAKAAVLAVSDGLRKDLHLCHPIMTRKRYEDEGCMLHPAYAIASGIGSDDEYTERAYRAGVVIEARDIKFRHAHPMDGMTPADEAMKRHNSFENHQLGRTIFEARNAGAGWGKVAFGVRIGRMVDPSFFWSFTRLLCSPSKRKGDVFLNPSVEKPHGMAMNVMLWWFLKTDCDSLLCIDDDMEFQPQDVDAIRATPAADIVTPIMCCRRGGHGPLVLGSWDDKAGRPSRIDPRDFQGLVPVRYVGLGFTLIRRWVLESMAAKANAAGVPVFGFDQIKGDDGKMSDDAVAVGARLAVNASIRVGHRFSAAVYWNNSDACPEYTENDYGDSMIHEQQQKEQ